MPAKIGPRYPIDSNTRAKIAAKLAQLGWTSYTLAEKIEVDRSTIQRILAGTTSSTPLLPKIVLELGLEATFGVDDNKNFIAEIGGGSPKDVPLVGYLGAGERYYADPEAGPWCAINAIEAPPGSVAETVAVMTRGSSLAPTYRDGDVLYFSRGATEQGTLIEHHCIVQIRSGPVQIKAVTRSADGRYTLAPCNKLSIGADEINVEWCAPILWVRRVRPIEE